MSEIFDWHSTIFFIQRREEEKLHVRIISLTFPCPQLRTKGHQTKTRPGAYFLNATHFSLFSPIHESRQRLFLDTFSVAHILCCFLFSSPLQGSSALTSLALSFLTQTFSMELDLAEELGTTEMLQVTVLATEELKSSQGNQLVTNNV